MKFNLKTLILIFAIQLVCGIAFSQDPPISEPKPTPQKPEIDRTLEEEAQFPGGKSAMMKFMAENLRYPQTAVDQEIQGKCYVQFIVQETGVLTDVKVKKGVTDCPECDTEAVRIIKSMPKWDSGKG